MSHKSTMTSEMKDIKLLVAAAEAIGCKLEQNAKVQFFSGSARGTAIYLRDWKYPVVISKEGKVSFDNYGGQWGNITRLNELKQQYAAQAVLQHINSSRGKLVHASTQKVNGKLVINIVDRR